MFCITCSICETTHDVTLYTKQVDLWALWLEFLLEFQPRPNQKATGFGPLPQSLTYNGGYGVGLKVVFRPSVR